MHARCDRCGRVFFYQGSHRLACERCVVSGTEEAPVQFKGDFAAGEDFEPRALSVIALPLPSITVPAEDE